MNQRQDIITELFQLKVDLNQSNKFKDESTRLYFEIDESSERRILFAKLSDSQKIEMCIEIKYNIWQIFESNKYFKLSGYLTGLLKKYEDIRFIQKISFDEYFNIEFHKLLGFK